MINYLIIINIISFIIMGLDKLFAIKNKRRISENTLLFLSIIGGVFGTTLGMIIFKHKIRKPKFLILIPIILILIIYIIKK